VTALNLPEVLRLHQLWLDGKAGGIRADLTGANLTRADLTRANLTDAYLTHANLACANLADANLTDANLTGAYLACANLTDANLTDANLTGANLTRADLTRANLTDAYLTGASLAGAYLADANLTDANLTRANLTRAIGIKWACIAPVGQGRRMVSAWSHESLSEPVIAGGCFRGTFAEFRSTIAGVPWDWGDGSEEDQARWRAECSAAADLLELAVES
jgi:hypothetical protein